MAALQGHLEAQFNLGIINTNGEGVPENYDKAAVWLTKLPQEAT
jgi:TPR repeat protein